MRRRYLSVIRDAAGALAEVGGALSGEAAAHVHLAVATGTRPDDPPRYVALPPRRIEAVVPLAGRSVAGVEVATGAVADVVRARLDLFAAPVLLADTPVPTLSREAVAADLLARGGLSLGLLGVMLRLANQPPIDIDEVREILKAARRGESFQPLLELLDVA